MAHFIFQKVLCTKIENKTLDFMNNVEYKMIYAQLFRN